MQNPILIDEFVTSERENDFLRVCHERYDVNIPTHIHDEYSQISVVTGGSAEYIGTSRSLYIKKGDVLFIRCGMNHSFVNLHSLRMYSIFFITDSLPDNDIFRRLAVVFEGFSQESACMDFSVSFTLSTDELLKVTDIAELMYGEYRSQDYGRNDMLMSCMTMLAVIMTRHMGTPAVSTKKDIMNIAATAAYIDNHYTESFTLADLAQMSHYSVRHFSRIFTETYHVPPQKYLFNLRLHHACTLLRETNMSIEDTALRSGFTDGNYFSRIFKKVIGVTPKQYRSKS